MRPKTTLSFQHDLDEMASEAHMSEEKAQRAMIDAARLADELRAEQETAMILERDRKLLEAQVIIVNLNSKSNKGLQILLKSSIYL